MSRLVRPLSSLAFLAALTLVPRADLIGVDDRSSCVGSVETLYRTNDFDELRALIAGLGHTLVPLSGFTAADLQGLDAAVVLHPTGTGQGFVGTEITDLGSFVSGGGGLLLLAEAGCSTQSFLSQMNQLLAPYGVSASAVQTDISGKIVAGFVAHPLTSGVNSVGVDYQRALSVGAPATDLTAGAGTQNVLAVVEASSAGGVVVMMSDLSLWSDIEVTADFGLQDLDNSQLATNVFGYLAGGGLSGTPSSISVTAGGSQVLTFNAGASLAGMSYQILGSVSGTSPGLPLFGVTIPLNFDPYLSFTFLWPNSPLLNGSGGVLNSAGQSTAVFTLPPASDPALAGLTVHHAGVVIDLVGSSITLPFVSAAEECLLLP